VEAEGGAGVSVTIRIERLVLHGIDQPNLWHGNSLTRRATYSALFHHAPGQFDVILTNPPFGGKGGKDAQKNFAFEPGATQALFVQANPIPLKWALERMGLCGGTMRLPLTRMEAAYEPVVEAALRGAGLL
jgi:dihydrodipicolinate synthase/N-acetylneuraminate lyase